MIAQSPCCVRNVETLSAGKTIRAKARKAKTLIFHHRSQKAFLFRPEVVAKHHLQRTIFRIEIDSHGDLKASSLPIVGIHHDGLPPLLIRNHYDYDWILVNESLGKTLEFWQSR